MKLSDIKGPRTLDVICDITGPVCSIAQDPAAAELFRRESLPKGMSRKDFLLNRVKDSLPALLRGHKDDLMTIMAALYGISVDEYAESLNLAKLVMDVFDIVGDTEFYELFISAQSGPKQSGSAQESTEAH